MRNGAKEAEVPGMAEPFWTELKADSLVEDPRDNLKIPNATIAQIIIIVTTSKGQLKK